jgi:deoxyxylulose-5-phosphate synthase
MEKRKNEGILQSINSPKDIKNLSENQLENSCTGDKRCSSKPVSKTEDICFNLGVVELTIALHKILIHLRPDCF